MRTLFDGDAHAMFFCGTRWFYCPGNTATWTILSLSPHAQTLARVSPTTLLLDFAGPPGLDAQWEVLFRDRKAPLRPGDTFAQDGGLTAIVEKVAQGRPMRVRFVLAKPIELGEFRLLLWRGGRLDQLALPVGGTIAFGANAR